MILLRRSLVSTFTQSLFATTLYPHSTTWRTRSGGMEISEAQPIVGQSVKVWRSDLASKATQVAEAQIIGHNDKEVGSFGRVLGFVGRL